VRSITSRATALHQATGAMTTPFQSDAADCELERIQLDELVERFRHRVRYFARRVEVRFGLDPQWHDDLISAGYWGLFKALRNRRPDAHERELSAYVSQRVEGAVIDEARRALSQVSNQSDLDPLDPDSEVVFAKTQLGWHQGAERAGPEDQADRHGRWRTIEASVEHLADDQRIDLGDRSQGRPAPGPTSEPDVADQPAASSPVSRASPLATLRNLATRVHSSDSESRDSNRHGTLSGRAALVLRRQQGVAAAGQGRSRPAISLSCGRVVAHEARCAPCTDRLQTGHCKPKVVASQR